MVRVVTAVMSVALVSLTLRLAAIEVALAGRGRGQLTVNRLALDIGQLLAAVVHRAARRVNQEMGQVTRRQLGAATATGCSVECGSTIAVCWTY